MGEGLGVGVACPSHVGTSNSGVNTKHWVSSRCFLSRMSKWAPAVPDCEAVTQICTTFWPSCAIFCCATYLVQSWQYFLEQRRTCIKRMTLIYVFLCCKVKVVLSLSMDQVGSLSTPCLTETHTKAGCTKTCTTLCSYPDFQKLAELRTSRRPRQETLPCFTGR